MNAPNFFLASVHLDILYLKQTPKLYNFNWGAWTDTVHLPPNLSVSKPKPAAPGVSMQSLRPQVALLQCF